MARQPATAVPLPRLSERDLRRYARHLTLPGFGGDAQRRLRNSRVLVIGAGGLGSPVLLYLAASGVGHLTIIDDDTVDESNLQRQVLHRESDIGRPKAESARDAVLRLDSEMSVEAIVGKIDPDNACELFENHDIVLDGADNFATRYLSNDAAEITKTPLVWGTISQFQGQVSVFWPGRGPMLRDLYPDIPDPDSVPSCAAGGVLGAMVGQIGSMLAIEAIKVLTGVGEPAIGRLLLIDVLVPEVRTLQFTADPDREPVTDLSDIEDVCGDSAYWAEESEQERKEQQQTADAPIRDGISAYEAADMLSSSDVQAILVDVREAPELTQAAIDGTIHIPLGRIRQQGWAAVARSVLDDSVATATDVIVNCRSGQRSQHAIDIFMMDPTTPRGIRLHNLNGGILAWLTGPGAS
ncbi:molybdopterin-synthase adenylyltransferase MoeB [Corynebacterium sp. H113]|uniref:molybdopterin-synthase adenylyltransferase MoeB n=1 Tax=Corynebacterium sp. H113 TaxID=3133419 RepID=UPI0030AA0080